LAGEIEVAVICLQAAYSTYLGVLIVGILSIIVIMYVIIV